MAKTKPVIIEQDPNAPTPKRLLAQSIVMLSTAARVILSTGLQRKDLIALLHRRAPSVGKPDIAAVVEAIDELGKDYAVKP